MQEEIKAIRDSQHRTEVVLTRMESDVANHIKRTDLAEVRISRIESALIGLAVVAVLGGVIKLLLG